MSSCCRAPAFTKRVWNSAFISPASYLRIIGKRGKNRSAFSLRGSLKCADTSAQLQSRQFRSTTFYFHTLFFLNQFKTQACELKSALFRPFTSLGQGPIKQSPSRQLLSRRGTFEPVSRRITATKRLSVVLRHIPKDVAVAVTSVQRHRQSILMVFFRGDLHTFRRCVTSLCACE